MPSSLTRNFFSKALPPVNQAFLLGTTDSNLHLKLGTYRDAHCDSRAAGSARAPHIFNSPSCGGDCYSKHVARKPTILLRKILKDLIVGEQL